MVTTAAVIAVAIVCVALWGGVRRTEHIRAPDAEDYGEPVINRGQFAHALRRPDRPPYDDPGAKL
jgi:hypothetical protein